MATVVVTPFTMALVVAPAALPFPFMMSALCFMASPLLVSPPAPFIVAIIITPPVVVAPAAAVPVASAIVAVAQMQRHSRG
ncbi:hypothetical protein WB66_06220 [bacteria symbiont BFo1 of Frankliniella occidentalis]|nr:hypothetical protein AI28_22135 [bacteria symbiont BFo1 of Frankliniella occidentalis]KYP85776.1 hypothetical protein WB66_06220 [bacteria symbiont BFo1 of Frankliniella occidentalis]KYP91390.1 hypothetical protein WB91_05545 [bacteria symbiont BFo1 of Frankliniella occidentalis]